MSDVDRINAELARRLPDIPRWLEARSMLLDGRCIPVGPVVIDGAELPTAVLLGREDEMAVVIGRPDGGSIVEASGGAEMIIVPPESGDYVASILPDWIRTRAILHLRRGAAPADRAGDVPIELIDASRIAAEPAIPKDLKEELLDAARRVPVAAAIVDSRPVSFSYVAWATETLWDISVDTLEEYRNRGLAGIVVEWMIDRMAREGKRPVWGSLDDNMPSLRAARRLGFHPVDSLDLFEPSRTR